MSFDNAYESITEDNDVSRWAFGTGFADPLEGVDTTVPAGLDRDALAALCVALGDDALVMSQRLGEWLTCAPELEVEVALANISLDLLGQARLLLTRAGKADATGRTEDDFAYLRDADTFRNVCLVERPNGDFAECVARLFLFGTWRLAQFATLRQHPDPVLAAIARKAVAELSYHRDFAAEWLVRLGDGTAESHERTQAAVDMLWPALGELRTADESAWSEARESVAHVLAAATLRQPEGDPTWDGPSGRSGEHTDDLTALLAVMQSVARADVEAVW